MVRDVGPWLAPALPPSVARGFLLLRMDTPGPSPAWSRAGPRRAHRAPCLRPAPNSPVSSGPPWPRSRRSRTRWNRRGRRAEDRQSVRRGAHRNRRPNVTERPRRGARHEVPVNGVFDCLQDRRRGSSLSRGLRGQIDFPGPPGRRSARSSPGAGQAVPALRERSVAAIIRRKIVPPTKGAPDAPTKEFSQETHRRHRAGLRRRAGTSPRCSSSPGPSRPPGPPCPRAGPPDSSSGSTPRATAPPAASTSDLEFTNLSGHTCTMHAYPGVCG